MRIFLITLVASLVPSIGLYQFGISQKIWPGHPVLVTTLIAMACGIAVQTWLERSAAFKKAK